MIVFLLKLDPSQIMVTNYAVPVAQFLAVSFVLSANIMSFKMLKSMKRISEFSDNVENTSTQRHKTLSEANICLFYITAFYIICPLPIFVVYLFGADKLFSFNWGSYLYTFTHIIYMSNNGINSMIVILRTKTLHEFYKTKLSFKTG